MLEIYKKKDFSLSHSYIILWLVGANTTFIHFECSYIWSLHHIFKWNPLYLPGSPTAVHSGHERILNTALHRADAISFTKHFEGREAPDKAPDKAPGPPFNWQMELIGPTGLKWARTLTFQRTEASRAGTLAPLSRHFLPGLGAFTVSCFHIPVAWLLRDKNFKQSQAAQGLAMLVPFISISIYPISPSEMAASEPIFLNKW